MGLLTVYCPAVTVSGFFYARAFLLPCTHHTLFVRYFFKTSTVGILLGVPCVAHFSGRAVFKV
jgi:hypothetical protein